MKSYPKSENFQKKGAFTIFNWDKVPDLIAVVSMKIKITKNIAQATAITHGGRFHADEIFASVILEKVLGHLTICRVSSLPSDIPDNTIIYDLGGGRWDHHQNGGNGRRFNGVPYASAGLIWRDFGKRLCSGTKDPRATWAQVDSFIQGIDAEDCGSMRRVKYPAKGNSVSMAIEGFNPLWDSKEDPDIAFLHACKIAASIFDNLFERILAKERARTAVETAIEKTDGPIMVLEQYLPWQQGVFFPSNKTIQKAAQILFVVFPSNRGGYNWTCVPTTINGIQQRKPVPDSWRGLSGNDLQAVTGVATATFVHPAGFIGGAETLSDAIRMADLAVHS